MVIATTADFATIGDIGPGVDPVATFEIVSSDLALLVG